MKVKRSIIFILYFFVCLELSAQRKEKRQIPDTLQLQELKHMIETLVIEGDRLLILGNPKAANEVFERIKQLDSRNAVANFKLAEGSLILGDKTSALNFITEAINLDAENKYYLILKADILAELNDYSTLVSVYEKLVTIPGNEPYYLELGGLYQYLRKLNAALDAYDRGEQFFGISEEVMRERQKIYLLKNDFAALERDWDRLILANPTEDRYTLELCAIFIANNKEELAVDRLKSLEDSNAQLLLAQIEINKGNFMKGIDYLGQCIDSESVPLLAKLQLLNYFVERIEERESFLALLNQLIETHSDQFEAIAFVGDVYLSLNDQANALLYYRMCLPMRGVDFNIWQQVISMEFQNQAYDSVNVHCEKALELYPNQAVFYFYDGLAFYSKKEFKQSVRQLEQGKKYASDPSMQALFYAQLGDAYNSVADHVQSDLAYEAALEIVSDNDHVLNNYSYFLSLRKEHLSKALPMAKKLIDKYPENSTYLDTYGWVLYQMEAYEESEKYLKKAVDLEVNGTLLEHYGDVLFKLGREKEALEQWHKAKKLGGATDLIESKIEAQKEDD